MGDGGYSAISWEQFWEEFPYDNCTNYVAYRLIKNGAASSYSPGNATYFGSYFSARGFATNPNPAVGAIAWWTANANPYIGATGHVAYVEEVNPPGYAAGSILVSEDNWGGTFDWRVYEPGTYFPTGFIHLKDVADTASGALVWSLTATGAVRRYAGMGKWEGIANSPIGKSISVGENGLVLVTGTNGNVYRYDGNGQWTILGMGFSDADAGTLNSNGLIWGLTATGAVRRYAGMGKWEGIANSPIGKSISVGENGLVLVTGTNGNVYRYDGNGQWTILGMGFSDADAGTLNSNGLIWGLTATGAVRRYAGMGKWEGIANSPIGKSISVGENGLVLVTGTNGNVYRYDGNGQWTILGMGFSDADAGAS